ncbi:MAG TPA: hypothetical protein VKU77_15135 [Streptosporangiaceae bacterium]|nr:hypothetical protein [Streptosporangiaceae bacterium]
MTVEDYGLARRMWHQLEPVHAVFWYAAGRAGTRSNGAPTGWPTPHGGRWALTAPSGWPN